MSSNSVAATVAPSSPEEIVESTYIVEVEANTTDLHDDDQEVTGFYRVDLSGSYPSTEKAVSAVLDVFHGSIAISVLEDFDIRVISTVGGDALEEDADHDDYSAADEGGCVTFIGTHDECVFEDTPGMVDLDDSMEAGDVTVH